MEKNYLPLCDLPLNQTGYIKSINCTGTIYRRFLDLGLIQGTQITPILISAFKNPKAYKFRGTLIAIRNEDANFITVSY